jgi:hypothetical protein
MDSSAIRFDTAHIGTLRTLLDRYPGLRSLGSFAQFHVVIDANVVMADLLQRVRYPSRGATAIEELVRSTVFVVHAPRWLETEIRQSAVPQVAAKLKLPIAELEARWNEYRSLIQWDDSLREPNCAAARCCDSADLPYVWLEHKISACGIVSRDAHISKLGGHRLSLDFVLSSRAYARSAAVSTGIRVGLVAGAMLILLMLALTVRGIAAAFRALPPAVQAVLVGVVLTAAMESKSRAWIAEQSCNLGSVLASVALGFSEGWASLTTLSQEAERAANIHLAVATALASKPPRSRAMTRPRRRRRLSAAQSGLPSSARSRNVGLAAPAWPPSAMQAVPPVSVSKKPHT